MSISELSNAFADTIEQSNPYVYNVSGGRLRRSAVAIDLLQQIGATASLALVMTRDE